MKLYFCVFVLYRCKDFKEPDHKNNCLLKTSQNPNWCTLNKADSMFTCPETCGFCGVEDGKFCEDFYLKKCMYILYLTIDYLVLLYYYYIFMIYK